MMAVFSRLEDFMKLFYLILKQTDKLNELIEGFRNKEIHHGTIIDAKSMKSGLAPWSDDAMTFGGLIRKSQKLEFNEEAKVLMFVLRDEQVEDVKNVVREIIDMEKEGTAIMFTQPIDDAEGLGE